MTLQNPDPIREDQRLQADPELALSGVRARPGQIAVTLLASVLVIMLLIYGLAHQRGEGAVTASAPAAAPAETTGAGQAPGPSGAVNPQAGQGQLPETTGSGQAPGQPAAGRTDSRQSGPAAPPAPAK